MPTGIGTAMLIGGLASAGASVAGSAIASKGNTKAAETQAASSDKALAQAKEIYQQQRADEAPFRSLGVSSLGALANGLGLPFDPTAGASTSPSTQPYQPGSVTPAQVGVPPGTLAGLGQAAQSGGLTGAVANKTQGKIQNATDIIASHAVNGKVPMQTPAGTVVWVPLDKVAEASHQGGKLYQGVNAPIQS